MKNQKKFKIVLFAAAGALVNTVPVQAEHLRGDLNGSDGSLEIKRDVVREQSGADATYQHDGALTELDAQADANLRLFQRGKQAAEMTERQLHAMGSSIIFPSDMDTQYQSTTASFMPNRAAEYQSGQSELRSKISEPAGATIKTDLRNDSAASPSENQFNKPSSEAEVKYSAVPPTPPAPPAPTVLAPQAEIKAEVDSSTIQEPSGADAKLEANKSVSTPAPAIETSIQSDAQSVKAQAQLGSPSEKNAIRSDVKAAEVQSGAINEAAGAQTKSVLTTGTAVESPSEIKAGAIQSGQAKTASTDAIVVNESAWSERLHTSLTSDPTLTATAQNVKVTSANGKMVLHGTVKSEAEKQAIGAKAEAIVGAYKVDNQLEVKGE